MDREEKHDCRGWRDIRTSIYEGERKNNGREV